MFGRVKIQNLIMTKYIVRQNRLRIAFCYQGRGRRLAKQQEAFPFRWKLTKPDSKFSPMFHRLSRIHSVPSLAIPNFIITNCLQDISGFKRLANACGSATTESDHIAVPCQTCFIEIQCNTHVLKSLYVINMINTQFSSLFMLSTWSILSSQVSLCYQHDQYSVLKSLYVINMINTQ